MSRRRYLLSRHRSSWAGCSPSVRSIAVFSGDIPHAVSLARQALDLLPEVGGDPSCRCHGDHDPRLLSEWGCDTCHRTARSQQRLR